ncbi:MAG TPA: phage protease [Terrimicrobiaceae bacterium]
MSSPLVGHAEKLPVPPVELLAFSFGNFQSANGQKHRFFEMDAKVVRENFHDQKVVRTGTLNSVPIYEGFSDRPDAPAIGWAHDLVIESKSIRLRPKWGKRGLEAIENRMFGFYAPLWSLRTENGVLRPFKLLAIGLTNVPVVHLALQAANDKQATPESRRSAMAQAVSDELAAIDPSIAPVPRYELAWRRALKKVPNIFQQ